MAELNKMVRRVRGIVADRERVIARLDELIVAEEPGSVRGLLLGARRDVKGQLAVDRRWLADLEAMTADIAERLHWGRP